MRDAGLLRRDQDPADGRAFLATLTAEGARRLRAAQRTHHAIVRELYLSRLDSAEVAQLGSLFEKVVSAQPR